MCFGGGDTPTNTTSKTATPPPSTAIKSSTDQTSANLTEKKRRQVAAVKYGISSTVKTSDSGDTSGVNLLMPAILGGQKTKLG